MEKTEVPRIVKSWTEIGVEETFPYFLLNLLDEALLIIDGNYHVRFRNQVAEKLFSKKSNICYRLYGRSKPCPNCPLRKGSVREFEEFKRNVKLNGKYLVVTLNPLNASDGTRVVEIINDVTEKKLLKEKLKRAEEKYWNLFENAGDGIIIFDKSGRIIAANRKCEEITGFKREDYIGKSFKKLVSTKRFTKKALKAYNDLLKGKSVRIELEIKNARKKEIIVELSSVPLREKGKIVGMLGIVRDVTEKKLLERKLERYSQHLEKMLKMRVKDFREMERRYSVLLEHAGDGVALVQNGLLIFVNEKIPKLTGYPKEHFLGQPFTKLVAPEYVKLVEDRYYKRMKGEDVPQIYEVEALSSDGERIPIELNATRINYHGKPADLVIMRDLRERKRMEQKLLESERLATIGRLATMVAHDLRNPLAGIQNASYYLKMQLKKHKVDCEMQEMVEIINREVEYANNTINDLLDFASVKKPEFKEVDVNKMIEEVLLLLEISENVEVIKKFGCLPKITADPHHLRRIFHNLVENAVQAMPNGGKLTIQTKKTGDFVEIRFTDTGMGISKENMDKIFTPFFTTRAKGIGMGLAVCKKLVEEHNGTIDVKSKEGTGSTFTVKLPIRQKGGEKR